MTTDNDKPRTIPNPRGLPSQIVSILIGAGRCPCCLGILDRWVCLECAYDTQAWHNQSKAKHDVAFDRREG